MFSPDEVVLHNEVVPHPLDLHVDARDMIEALENSVRYLAGIIEPGDELLAQRAVRAALSKYAERGSITEACGEARRLLLTS